MKKSLVIPIIFILTITQAICQIPNAFNYQAVARDQGAQRMINQTISLEINIRDGSESGPVVYTERFTGVSTGELGLFTLKIGSGTPQNNTNFENIAWTNGSKYMEVSMDPANGLAFQSMGAFELLTVPYALNAKNAESVSIAIGELTDVGASRSDCGPDIEVEWYRMGRYFR